VKLRKRWEIRAGQCTEAKRRQTGFAVSQASLWHIRCLLADLLGMLKNTCFEFRRNGSVTAAIDQAIKWKEAEIRYKPVAYAETFHGGASFSGIWWSFVFGVRCLWRHNMTSYSCFQTNVLAKFV